MNSDDRLMTAHESIGPAFHLPQLPPRRAKARNCFAGYDLEFRSNTPPFTAFWNESQAEHRNFHGKGSQVAPTFVPRAPLGSVPKLVAIPTLRSLQIFDSGLSDQGIEHLRGNPSIEKLWLCDLPGVTDESIDVLVSMTALKELYVQDTKVSAAGIKSLSVARPDIDLSPEELQH